MLITRVLVNKKKKKEEEKTNENVERRETIKGDEDILRATLIIFCGLK